EYTIEKLEYLTELNPSHAQAVKSLLKFYFHIRELWTKNAIDKLKRQYDLDLRKKEHRLYFARYAAIQELKWKRQLSSSPNTVKEVTQPIKKSNQESNTESDPAPEKTPHKPDYKPSYKQLEWFACLCLLGRILPAGKPLNGSENSPAMRVLGSPKTLTELDYNYKQLVKHHHPDVSPFCSEESQARFNYIRQLYSLFRKNWDALKPTASITDQQLNSRMNAKTPFKPDSFWYWLE
ncbi:UNVERIFIED_CONTAM: hypothetical protein BEN50_18170, partial [Euhalothece sp. KZN 001]